MAGGEAGGRLLCSGRHNCSSYVRGGVHLTHGAFLPTNIVKVTLATSYSCKRVFANFHTASEIEMLVPKEHN